MQMLATEAMLGRYGLLAREETIAEPPVEGGEGKEHGDGNAQQRHTGSLLGLKERGEHIAQPRQHVWFKLYKNPHNSKGYHYLRNPNLDDGRLAPDASAQYK
jgi:hypothetical protein